MRHRRLAVAAALAAVATVAGSCAKIGAPPGGPVRTVPPELLRVTPESGAVNVNARGVTFEFDVVVNDRAGGDLENLFVLSPREGRPRVIWRRERVEVRPRDGFRPNTAYTVTLLPGMSDLRGNVLRTGRTVVFSTGPRIPTYFVHGRVFDWMTERVAPRARVEVIRRPDSLPYVAVADSSGQFTAGPLEEGSYTVRSFLDANNNREQDAAEPWDSVAIVVRGTSPFVELLAAPRDTVPPRIVTVTVGDSVTLTVNFDRPLDPSVPLTAAGFRVLRADSTPLRVTRALTRRDAEARRAARDSAAADTAGARRDTTARRDTAALARALPPVIQARPSRPPPPRDIVLTVDSLTPLQPGTSYRVIANAARGLLGAVRASERVFTVPRPRTDTTRAAPPPAAAPSSRPPTPPAARP